MRLPDIPSRHRLLVRAVSTVGSGALSIVRRRDVAPEHEPLVRAAYSVATAALTWLGGTKAFANQDIDSDDLRDLVAPGGSTAGAPMRYAAIDSPERETPFGFVASASDFDSWMVENATWKSQATLNLAAAATAGVVSWVAWNPVQDLKDRLDAKLPAGLGRGLNAVMNSSLMAFTALALDKAEEFIAREAIDGHTNFAPVEIDLPPHIRASLDLLLDQPHPHSQDVAEVVRAQLAHARFFVTVTYSTKQFPGSDPIELSDEDFAALLAEEDMSSIDVYLDSDAPHAVPATQTYPVVGIVTPRSEDAPGDGDETLELSLTITDGMLSRIDLVGAENGDDLIMAAETAERLGASAPGTLHPDGIEGYLDTESPEGEWIPVGVSSSEDSGYWSSLEVLRSDDEPTLTLADWPSPGDLTFRTDRS